MLNAENMVRYSKFCSIIATLCELAAPNLLSKLYDLSKTVSENAFFNVKLHSKQNRPMLSCVVCSAQECAHVTFRLCFSLFCFTVIRAYFVN